MGNPNSSVSELKKTTLLTAHPDLSNAAQRRRGNKELGHESFQLMYNRTAPYPSQRVDKSIWNMPQKKYNWA